MFVLSNSCCKKPGFASYTGKINPTCPPRAEIAATANWCAQQVQSGHRVGFSRPIWEPVHDVGVSWQAMTACCWHCWGKAGMCRILPGWPLHWSPWLALFERQLCTVPPSHPPWVKVWPQIGKRTLQVMSSTSIYQALEYLKGYGRFPSSFESRMGIVALALGCRFWQWGTPISGIVGEITCIGLRLAAIFTGNCQPKLCILLLYNWAICWPLSVSNSTAVLVELVLGSHVPSLETRCQ